MESMVSAKYKISIPISIRKRYKINEKTRLKWVSNGHTISIMPISNPKSAHKDYSHKGKS